MKKLAQQEQHRGSHPVEGPVLAGPEELVDGPGEQIGKGEPVASSPTRPSSSPWQKRSGRWV